MGLAYIEIKQDRFAASTTNPEPGSIVATMEVNPNPANVKVNPE
jgi:hypothetical protein